MKNAASVIAISLALTSSAFAGNIDPVVEVVVVDPPAAAYDWGGFYVGGAFGSDSGNMEYFTPDIGPYTLDAAASYGLFAGYNVHNGSFVYGGELALGQTNLFPAGFPLESYDYMADLKLRAGYAMGAALVYAFAGASASGYTLTPTDSWQNTGYNYGIGIDFMLSGISSNMFAGVEYILRDMSGALPAPFIPQTQNTTTNTIQARVGWNF